MARRSRRGFLFGIEVFTNWIILQHHNHKDTHKSTRGWLKDCRSETVRLSCQEAQRNLSVSLLVVVVTAVLCCCCFLALAVHGLSATVCEREKVIRKEKGARVTTTIIIIKTTVFEETAKAVQDVAVQRNKRRNGGVETEKATCSFIHTCIFFDGFQRS